MSQNTPGTVRYFSYTDADRPLCPFSKQFRGQGWYYARPDGDWSAQYFDSKDEAAEAYDHYLRCSGIWAR